MEYVIGVVIIVGIVWVIAYVSSAKKKEIRKEALTNVLESRKNREEHGVDRETAEVSEKLITDEVVFHPDEVKANEVKEEESQEVAKQEAIDKEKQDAKFVYYFLNNLMKKLFYHFRTDTWNELKAIEVAPEMKDCDLEKVKEILPEDEKELLMEVLDCMVLRDNQYTILNLKQLKNVFGKMVLPFYPSYYKVFGNEIRHTTFLNKTTLSLFHHLSGKKFRVGYKNRYSNGVTAFEWKNDRYKVFGKDGAKLCDAVFKDGKIYDGIAVEIVEDQSTREWTVEKTKTWRQGVCQEDRLHYFYNIPCK